MGLIKMRLVVTKGGVIINELELITDDDISDLNNLNYFIGRSTECHIMLDGHDISRNHAQLIFVDNSWKLKKTTTSGLVFLNNASIREGQVQSGDIIKISDYSIEVKFDDKDFQPPEESNEEQRTETLQQESNEEQVTETLGDTQGNEQSEFGPKLDLAEDIKEDLAEVEVDDEQQQQEEEVPQEEKNDDMGEEFTIDGDNGFGLDTEMNNDQEGEVASPFDTGGTAIDEGEKTQIVKSFVEFELDISGEYTTFDKYYINRDEVFIGRDQNKCQISLEDPECSQVHAVIRRKGTICEIEDLNSTNGVILNGARINQANLKNKDEFLIGNTSFRLTVKSELIHAEKSGLMQVQSREEVEVEEVVEEEVDIFQEGEDNAAPVMIDNDGSATAKVENVQHTSSGDAQGKSLFSKEALQDPERRKKLLIFAVIGAALWVILGEEETETVQVKEKKEVAKKDNRLVKEKKDEIKGAATQKGNNPKRSYQNLPQDLQEYVRANYELAKTEILEYGNFEQGLQYIDKIKEYIDEFEQSRSLEITAKEEFKKLEEIEKEKKRKQEEEERRIRVVNLLEKAGEAFEKEKIELVQSLLNKVAELDPENIDASQLRLQLDAYIKEQERKALEEAEKQARRNRLLGQLAPGKKLFLKESWYEAIIELEKFLAIEDNDDDLIKEATEKLKKAVAKVKESVDPLLTKAQSLQEGQDLKGAYEAYKDILKIDPTHAQAVSEMVKIKEVIEKQAQQIYREAIIYESLNYLKNAREKFLEVQQIAPTDSIYYERAKNKLKYYAEY